jgi:hypothetical protein
VFFGKIYVILTSNVLIGKNVFENYVFFNCSVIKSTIVLVLPCFAIYMSVIDSSRNICNCIRNASVNTYMMGRDIYVFTHHIRINRRISYISANHIRISNVSPHQIRMNRRISYVFTHHIRINRRISYISANHIRISNVSPSNTYEQTHFLRLYPSYTY